MVGEKFPDMWPRCWTKETSSTNFWTWNIETCVQSYMRHILVQNLCRIVNFDIVTRAQWVSDMRNSCFNYNAVVLNSQNPTTHCSFTTLYNNNVVLYYSILLNIFYSDFYGTSNLLSHSLEHFFSFSNLLPTILSLTN